MIIRRPTSRSLRARSISVPYEHRSYTASRLRNKIQIFFTKKSFYIFLQFVCDYVKRWIEVYTNFQLIYREFTDIASNFYFKEAYIKTHMKMIMYFMGLLTGYILHRIQKQE